MPTCKRFGTSGAAVDQVAALPIPGRELRTMAANIARTASADPPSANQVPAAAGRLVSRRYLRDRFGPILPPVADLRSILRQLADAGAIWRLRLNASWSESCSNW